MKGIVLSKKMLAAYGIFVVLFSAQYAHAETVELGTPAFGGTGCPAGLVPQVTISKGIISVRYNNFLLQDAAASLVGRANCSIRLPININGRYRVGVESIELRGISRVPAQANLKFHADAGFVGAGQIAVDQTVTGPKGTQNVRLAQRASSVERTACGADSMLSLNANMIFTKSQGATGVRGQARNLDAKLVLEACN